MNLNTVRALEECLPGDCNGFISSDCTLRHDGECPVHDHAEYKLVAWGSKWIDNRYTLVPVSA